MKSSAWAYSIKWNQGGKYDLQFCHNKIVLKTWKYDILDIFWGKRLKRSLIWFEGRIRLEVNSSHYYIWRSFCTFSYSQTYQWRISFLIYDVIDDQKSFSWEGKLTFYGWGYYLRAVSSLSFLPLTVYDITKKPWYGWNILNCTETSNKNARYYSRDY